MTTTEHNRDDRRWRFANSLLELAGEADHLGLPHLAARLDADFDDVSQRWGLTDEATLMDRLESQARDRDIDHAIERRRDDALDGAL